ncbi:chemotaxis protein CheX [Dactylosporangium sucinum]|uniref:Chemotaxis phosphatase CheX-like domain-containing protein n=1 Tax=Dactylosporangium sucinum TaxID=1424081 RepID=A0A917UG29_9ACTN|nr:chemotaxis protein CheX [Dactylosporangium sucinum]GGM88181.1 hypothetical protein GCM10007977_107730 [Dactylosporangium sucinum]
MERPTLVTDATITADDLHGIIWQVWTAYLGTTPAARPAQVPAGRAELTASVCIAGAWLGHVVLRAGLPAAGAIAAAMLELDPAAVKPDDVQDAAGELMNIVTGNVKSLLPQPSHVSLPQVVIGEADVLWPGAEPVCGAAVAWDQHLVTIEVLRGTPSP